MSYIHIENLKRKLIVTAIIFLGLLLVVLSDITCLFFSLFHIPCLFCGMTRAWSAALLFDFREAFAQHAMFWSVPLLYLFVMFDAKPFRKSALNYFAWGFLAAGYFVNYLYHYLLWQI